MLRRLTVVVVALVVAICSALPAQNAPGRAAHLGPKSSTKLEDGAECSIADGTCPGCRSSHQSFDKHKPDSHKCCSRLGRKFLCNTNTPKVCCDAYQMTRTEEMVGRDTVFWCACRKQAPGFSSL